MFNMGNLDMAALASCDRVSLETDSSVLNAKSTATSISPIHTSYRHINIAKSYLTYTSSVMNI